MTSFSAADSFRMDPSSWNSSLRRSMGLGGQEDALAQRLGNLLRAIVAAPAVREEDGALEHLLDLDVGAARSIVEHALGGGSGRSEVQHAIVCKYRHACVSVGRVVCVCVFVVSYAVMYVWMYVYACV